MAKHFISMKKHQEEVDELKDTINVLSTEKDSEVRSLEDQVLKLKSKNEALYQDKESHEALKIENAILTGKVEALELSNNFRLIPIDEFKTISTKLGGLTKGNHKLQNERDSLSVQVKELKKIVNNYEKQIEDYRKTITKSEDEKTILRNIITNLSKPKVTIKELRDYEMGKNDKEKSRDRTNEVPRNPQK